MQLPWQLALGHSKQWQVQLGANGNLRGGVTMTTTHLFVPGI
jgi:hypothetical protein